jgi:hypothetical protein
LRRYYWGNLTSSDQLLAGASSLIAHLEVFSLKLSGNMRTGESIIAQGVNGKATTWSDITSNETFARLTWAISRFRPNMVKAAIMSKPGVVAPRANLWANCFKMSRDGRRLDRLNGLCKQKGPSVILIETETGKKMAWYTPFGVRPGGLTVDMTYMWSRDAFGYNLHDHSSAYPWNSPHYSVYDHWTYGPTFGSGHDMMVKKDLTGGTCRLGSTYAGYASHNTRMCGGTTFAIRAMEVWHLHLDLGNEHTFAAGEAPSAVASTAEIGAMVGRCRMTQG